SFQAQVNHALSHAEELDVAAVGAEIGPHTIQSARDSRFNIEWMQTKKNKRGAAKPGGGGAGKISHPPSPCHRWSPGPGTMPSRTTPSIAGLILQLFLGCGDRRRFRVPAAGPRYDRRLREDFFPENWTL